METVKFSVARALGDGLRIAKDRFRFFAIATLIFVAILGGCIGFAIITAWLGGFSQEFIARFTVSESGFVNAEEMRAFHLGVTGLYATLAIILLVVFEGLRAGYIKLVLAVQDKEKATLDSLFSYFHLVPKILFAHFLWFGTYCLLALGGFALVKVSIIFIFLVIPVLIYVLLRYMFVTYFIIDKNTGPLESFYLSWNATRGNVARIFGMFFNDTAIFIFALLVMSGMQLIFQLFGSTTDSLFWKIFAVYMYSLLFLTISTMVWVNAYRQLVPKDDETTNA